MKSLKKIMACTLACNLLFCSSLSNSTFATTSNTYNKGDINGDGVINTADYISMATFLNGGAMASGSVAERLDLNRNYIIDSYDLQILRDILLGYSSSVEVTSVNTNSLPSESDIDYRVYNPVTGYLKHTYTVDANTTTVSSIGNSRGIMYGHDSRMFQDGMQGVLNVQDASGNNMGTAFVIDSHTILTAAHVLYNYKKHTIKKNLRFVVYDDYDTPTNTVIFPKSYHIPQDFCNSMQRDLNGDFVYISEWDYAIVTVNDDLSNYINFDIGVMRSGDMYQPVYVTGFGSYGNNPLDQSLVNPYFVDTKSTSMGDLMEDNPYSDTFINYDADTVGGDSGGPVWVYNAINNTKTVIGINIYSRTDGTTINEYNTGYRINSNILHAIFNNDYNLSEGWE